MFNLFKETWVALRDLNYGNQIVKFPWKKVFRHWLAAFVWIFAIWIFGLILVWTYFAPQVPKMIADTNLSKPLILGDSKNILMIDTSASASAANNYKAALIVGKEDIWYKIDDKTSSIKKEVILSWVKDNKIKIWFGGTGLIILITLFMVLSLGVSQMIGLLFWTIVFWIGGKLLSKDISYFNTLKICMYASIPGIIINGFGLGNTGTFGIIMPLVLFAWYSAMWIYKLPLAFRR